MILVLQVTPLDTTFHKNHMSDKVLFHPPHGVKPYQEPDQLLYAMPMSDFLPDILCSKQLNAASRKSRLDIYSLWSRAESHLVSGGIASIVQSDHNELLQQRRRGIIKLETWFEIDKD